MPPLSRRWAAVGVLSVTLAVLSIPINLWYAVLWRGALERAHDHELAVMANLEMTYQTQAQLKTLREEFGQQMTEAVTRLEHLDERRRSAEDRRLEAATLALTGCR